MEYSQALSYIRVMRGRGYSDSQIAFNIAKSGLPDALIQKAFRELPKPQPRPAGPSVEPSVPVPSSQPEEPIRVEPVRAEPARTYHPAHKPPAIAPVQSGRPVQAPLPVAPSPAPAFAAPAPARPVIPVSAPPAAPPLSQNWEATVVTGASQPAPPTVTSWKQFAQKEYETLGILPRCKMILSRPDEFFNTISPQGVGAAYLHYVVMSLFVAVLSGILMLGVQSYLSPTTGIDVLIGSVLLQVPVLFIGALIAGAVLTPIGLVIYHLFLKLVGGKGTYKSTLKTAYYLSTVAPLLLIPVVGIFVGLYAIWLSLVAYSRVHKISLFRTFLALVAPGLLIGAIFVILGLTLFAGFLAMLIPLVSGIAGSLPVTP